MTRAADDFPVIHARLEELRRERVRETANSNQHRTDRSKSYDVEYEDKQMPHGRNVVHIKERPAF